MGWGPEYFSKGVLLLQCFTYPFYIYEENFGLLYAPRHDLSSALVLKLCSYGMLPVTLE